MAESEDAELFYKLVKAGSKKAVKDGSAALDLPEDIQKFLASQLSFAFDLLKKGNKLTPRYLGVLLAHKGIGIADLASSKRYDCAI